MTSAFCTAWQQSDRKRTVFEMECLKIIADVTRSNIVNKEVVC